MDTTGNGREEDDFFLEMTDDSSESDGMQGDEGETEVCFMDEDQKDEGTDVEGHGTELEECGPLTSEPLEETEVLDQEAPTITPDESYNQLVADFETVKAERDKFKEQLIRKAADLDNYRKRVAREREDQKRYGNEKFAQELLPVVDNMERALSALGGDEASASLRDGVDMVYKQLLAALKRFGVESFDSKGTPFDPQKHEAIQQVESDEVETGIILDEFQKGYFINDRLLRPAMVSVAKNSNN